MDIVPWVIAFTWMFIGLLQTFSAMRAQKESMKWFWKYMETQGVHKPNVRR